MMAPPAAPETPALKRLRLRSMGSCLAAALAIAGVTILVRIHPLAVLVVPAIVGTAIVLTARYWWVKNAVDSEYAAARACDADDGTRP